jgi:hypothetical protein
MNTMGMPGAVSRSPRATQARLRAYQDRALVASRRDAIRGSIHVTGVDDIVVFANRVQIDGRVAPGGDRLPHHTTNGLACEVNPAPSSRA